MREDRKRTRRLDDFPQFEIREQQRQLVVEGRAVPLGARAFDVLLVLVVHLDRVVGKDELLDRVWPGVVVEENNLQVQIHALRKALGARAIVTVPGRGYRFVAPLPDRGTAALGRP